MDSAALEDFLKGIESMGREIHELERQVLAHPEDEDLVQKLETMRTIHAHAKLTYYFEVTRRLVSVMFHK